MKQFSNREVEKLLHNNGYYLNRINGSHFIYKNNLGHHISVPKSLKSVIILRLIKENILK